MHLCRKVPMLGLRRDWINRCRLFCFVRRNALMVNAIRLKFSGLLTCVTEMRAAVCGVASLVVSGFALAAESPKPDSPTVLNAFATTLTKVEVKPGQTTVAAAWDFTNHTDSPIAVERVESSCGCLAGQTGTQVVEPGKSGRIEASFQPGAYRGTIRKSIHVRFVNEDKPIELVMEAHIPSPVELSTNELAWTQGQSASTQTIEVKSGTGASFSITDLIGVSPELFTITKEPLADSIGYRLSITPAGKTNPGTQILQVRTDSPDPRDQVLAVFLQTRPADTQASRAPSQTAATP